MAPKFWMEFRRLTMTFLRDIASAPFERLTVTIIGSISGVSPTAIARPKSSASVQLCLVRPMMTKDDRHHDDHEADHQPREGVDALVEAREHALARELFADGAEIGVGAGIDDQAARGAAQHVAALETGVREFQRDFGGRAAVAGVLSRSAWIRRSGRTG